MFNNFPGNSERKLVSTYEGYHGATARQLMTQIPVVENTCSIKPRIFGHFQKVHEEFTNAMTTTQWVLFKVCSKKSCCSVELAVLKHYYFFFIYILNPTVLGFPFSNIGPDLGSM